MKYLLLNIKLKAIIVNIILDHLIARWRLQVSYLLLSILVFLIGLLSPIFLDDYFSSKGNYIFNTTDITIAILIYAFSLSVIYGYLIITKFRVNGQEIYKEIQYATKIVKFMNYISKNIEESYRDPDIQENINKQIIYNGKTYNKEYFVKIIISIINIKLILLYFNTINSNFIMNNKIDMNVVADSIDKKEFGELYKNILFNDNIITNSSYQTLLNNIKESISNSLNKKQWYKENFEDNEILGLISNVLDFWYSHFHHFSKYAKISK